MPAAADEHVENYLRTALGFIGVKDLEFIVAEGVQLGQEHREKALASGMLAASELMAA